MGEGCDGFCGVGRLVTVFCRALTDLPEAGLFGDLRIGDLREAPSSRMGRKPFLVGLFLFLRCRP
jgi:hypothetical protein